jgi:hypothetical protein
MIERPRAISAILVAIGFLAGASATIVGALADEAPATDREVHAMPPDQALAILGRMVATPDGHDLGRLIDVLVDAAGIPQAGVIDFGGFMGVGARKIAVHWSTLRFDPANTKQPITLELTPDQIKGVPEYGDPSKAAPVVGPGPALPPPVPPAPVAPASAAPSPPVSR